MGLECCSNRSNEEILKYTIDKSKEIKEKGKENLQSAKDKLAPFIDEKKKQMQPYLDVGYHKYLMS